MSVNRGGPEGTKTIGEIDEYSDLTKQKYAFRHDLDMSTQDASGNIKFTPLGGTTVAGGIERNEVAELVALIPMYEQFQVREGDNQGTTPGSAYCELEFYRHPSNFNNSNVDYTVDDTAFSYSRATELANNDLLYFNLLTLTTAFNDTVNGTGGGGDSGGRTQTPLLFRDWFGRGPLFYDDDNVTVGGYMDWTQVDNQKLSVLGEYHAYWDTFEMEDPALREVRG